MKERYLLQQPRDLEDMATDKVAAWIGKQGNNIESTIAKLHKHDVAKAEAVLSQKIEIMRDRLQRIVPSRFHNKLITKTIAELYSQSLIIKDRTEVDEIVTASIINERMAETLFTKNVKSLSLSFDHFMMLRKSLNSKSHLLTGLVSLTLDPSEPYDSIHFTVHVEEDIIQMFEKLHSLKHLNLSIFFTGRIMSSVVKYCTLIEDLVLNSEYPLIFDTITLLSHLTNLKRLTLGTEITSSGYEIILLHCKKLEYITCFTHSNHIEMSKAIKRIASQPNARALNLKCYSIQEDTIDELSMVFQTCPLIENLNLRQPLLSMFNYVIIIPLLKKLKYLREMTLWIHNIMYAPTMFVLKEVGHKLEYLCYVGGNEIDLNAMITISHMCPNLKSFHLVQRKYLHNMQSGSGSAEKKRKMEISPFIKLKKLTLKVGHPPLTAQELQRVHEPILLLLSNCPNVEFIEISMPNWFTEDAMLTVLDKNPLTYLNKFKISYSHGKMTTLVMQQLIKNCNNQPEVIEIVGRKC